MLVATYSITGTGVESEAVAALVAASGVTGFVFGLFNALAISPRKEAQCGRLTCRASSSRIQARRQHQILVLPHPRFLISAAPRARPEMWTSSSSESNRNVSP